MIITYTVKAGDSLSSIAEEFLGDLLRFDEIANLNNIANPNLISVGQVLKIDTGVPAPEAPAYLSTGVMASTQDFSVTSLVPGLNLPTVSAQPVIKTVTQASTTATTPRPATQVLPIIAKNNFYEDYKYFIWFGGVAALAFVLMNIKFSRN